MFFATDPWLASRLSITFGIIFLAMDEVSKMLYRFFHAAEIVAQNRQDLSSIYVHN